MGKCGKGNPSNNRSDSLCHRRQSISTWAPTTLAKLCLSQQSNATALEYGAAAQVIKRSQTLSCYRSKPCTGIPPRRRSAAAATLQLQSLTKNLLPLLRLQSYLVFLPSFRELKHTLASSPMAASPAAATAALTPTDDLQVYTLRERFHNLKPPKASATKGGGRAR